MKRLCNKASSSDTIAFTTKVVAIKLISQYEAIYWFPDQVGDGLEVCSKDEIATSLRSSQ